jgi:hypothetical protein
MVLSKISEVTSYYLEEEAETLHNFYDKLIEVARPSKSIRSVLVCV